MTVIDSALSPQYLTLYETGDLEKKLIILNGHYNYCRLCPHQCGVNRFKGELGRCCSGFLPRIASYNTHYGEEPPISGLNGSGTIFFSGCTGRCIFCQNYPISQLETGSEVSEEELADMMVELQSRGCHNINFVTPTHFLPSIVSSLHLAIGKGLRIPLVYNTSGYERVEIIKLLNGIIDLYLPDAKYADNSVAKAVSGFTNYMENNRAALIEMFKQVGNLIVNNGIAVKGLIIRHLILPENLSGTDDVLHFISTQLSPDVYVSLMDQYFPVYKALEHPVLSRKITLEEYNTAIDTFYRSGLQSGWIQEHINSL